MDLGENVDDYLNRRIEDCSIPPVLGMSIVDRINRFTGALGGLVSFVDNHKRKTPITLNIKKSHHVDDKYILIAPEQEEKIVGIEHLPTADFSQLQLLHLNFGLTLQDLEGFSGQRMFVEPSIF